MQQISVETQLKNLDRFADILCETRPAQEDILRSFQSLFRQRLRMVETLSARDARLPDFDPARFAQGISWLAEAPLDDLAPLLGESAKGMLPALTEAFPSGRVFAALEPLFLDEDYNLPGACRHLLDGNLPALNSLAEEAGLPPALYRFALETVLGPVAALLEQRVAGLLEDKDWTQGYCPVCGQAPSIGYLARREKIDLESLVGGGGQKYLHCSLCSHVWRYRRDACPGCGTTEPKSREVLHATDSPQERVELCTKCKGYHLTLDFREYEHDPDLLIAPVALMHLDIIAKDKGALPLYLAPWNTDE